MDCDYLTDTHLSEVCSNKNNVWEADAVGSCLLKRVVGESCDGWGWWMRGDCGELQLTVDTGPGEQSQPDHQLSSWNKDSEDDSDDVTDTMKKKSCLALQACEHQWASYFNQNLRKFTLQLNSQFWFNLWKLNFLKCENEIDHWW